jgi:hypothetical protein
MANFETANRNLEALSSALFLKLEAQKGQVLLDIALLLQENGLEDDVDKRLVGEAVEFVENPTEEVEAVMKHATAIGAVHAEYDMQEIAQPAAIDALYEYIYALQCVIQIKFAEEVFKRQPFDSAETKTAIHQASLSAKMLVRGWEDNTFLDVVNEFQAKLDAL